MKSCENCRFCLMQDVGYSNYTVEGIDVHCLKRIHPESGFDKWYGGDERLEFAEKCKGYESGTPVCIDVDQEDRVDPKGPLSKFYVTNDDEVAKLLDEWENEK